MHKLHEAAIKNLYLFATTILIVAAKTNGFNSTKPRDECFTLSNARCRDTMGDVDFTLTACGETMHTRGRDQIAYLCKFLDTCDDHPREWKCLSSGSIIGCHYCIHEKVLREGQRKSRIYGKVEEEKENDTIIVTNNIIKSRGDLFLLCLGIISMILALSLWYFHRSGRINNFHIPNTMVLIISITILIDLAARQYFGP